MQVSIIVRGIVYSRGPYWVPFDNIGLLNVLPKQNKIRPFLCVEDIIIKWKHFTDSDHAERNKSKPTNT